ncbi:MAG TPA: hypothetical protein VIP78_10880 [Candidatus Dormibacteraeota bacterium]
MKTQTERGRYGQWLLDARKARGLDTQTKAREALLTDGIVIGQSAYAAYEAGSKDPSRNHMPLLVGFWGPPPEEPEPEPVADMAALVAALTAQTKVLGALTGDAAERQRAWVIEAVQNEIAPLWETIRELEERVREALPHGAKLPGGRR